MPARLLIAGLRGRPEGIASASVAAQSIVGLEIKKAILALHTLARLHVGLAVALACGQAVKVVVLQANTVGAATHGTRREAIAGLACIRGCARGRGIAEKRRLACLTIDAGRVVSAGGANATTQQAPLGIQAAAHGGGLVLTGISVSVALTLAAWVGAAGHTSHPGHGGVKAAVTLEVLLEYALVIERLALAAATTLCVVLAIANARLQTM